MGDMADWINEQDGYDDDGPRVHRILFEPCAVGEHSDCIGFSNGLRRDAEQTICSCPCHATTKES